MQKAIMNYRTLDNLNAKCARLHLRIQKEVSNVRCRFEITRDVVEVHRGLHSYLSHTILMFNPNNPDDVCVQVTHLDVRGKNTLEEGSKNPFKGKEKCIH